MITCRVLDSAEIRRYEFFLKERNMSSRSMYFGYAITDEAVEQLVQHMTDNIDKHRVVVAEDENMDIVGTVHIANMSATEVEFGVMVAEAYRKQGVSSLLMDYAITWCQNRGLSNIYMHCLSFNQPILHLVKKHGLGVSNEYGDSDARVVLPPTNAFTIGKEAFYRQHHLLQKNILSFKRMLSV